MHRQPLLDLLESYARRYPEETLTVQAFQCFVRAESECFQRSLLSGHITGSGWIVDASGMRTLLTHHRKLNVWLQPGGHADGDPDVLAVAMKECCEETGLDDIAPVSTEILDLDIHRIPTRGEVPSHLHYDVRFFVRDSGAGHYTVTEESHDLAWVAHEDLERYTTEISMMRMRDKVVRFLSGSN
jgi:8-oxo-dGTP pyrophosphatase MutT (NUDIX family)